MDRGEIYKHFLEMFFNTLDNNSQFYSAKEMAELQKSRKGKEMFVGIGAFIGLSMLPHEKVPYLEVKGICEEALWIKRRSWK